MSMTDYSTVSDYTLQVLGMFTDGDTLVCTNMYRHAHAPWQVSGPGFYLSGSNLQGPDCQVSSISSQGVMHVCLHALGCIVCLHHILHMRAHAFLEGS